MVLVDTSVWIDLTRDRQQAALLDVLEELHRDGRIVVVVPQIVADEFARNKQKAVQERIKGSTADLRRARAVLSDLGESRSAKRALKALADTDHQLDVLTESATRTISRIEVLLGSSRRIATTDALLSRVAQRALAGKAPFHRQRNEVADAILVETYSDLVKERVRGRRYAFVTHNTRDFSHPSDDTRKPHPDLASLFSPIRSLFMTSLAQTLRRIAPEAVSETMLNYEVLPEPRRISEVVAASDEFFDKIWYDRHQQLLHKVVTGKVKVVKRTPPGYNPRLIEERTLRSARRHAKRIERRYGPSNVGPWTDFEWGMLNGKLSALRWVLGDEWDFLDT